MATSELKNIIEWKEAYKEAKSNPNAYFWNSGHHAVRTQRFNALNETIMVETMWGYMGKLEHAWFNKAYARYS